MSLAPKKLVSLPRLCDKNEAISFSVMFFMNLMRRSSINSKPKSTFWSSAPTLCYSQNLQTVLSFSNFLTKPRKTWMNLRITSLRPTWHVAILWAVCHLLRWLLGLLDIHIWAKSSGALDCRRWASALGVDHCHPVATESLWCGWVWPQYCSSVVSVTEVPA